MIALEYQTSKERTLRKKKDRDETMLRFNHLFMDKKPGDQKIENEDIQSGNRNFPSSFLLQVSRKFVFPFYKVNILYLNFSP